jgi:glycerol-3-phosphate dehydrogenase
MKIKKLQKKLSKLYPSVVVSEKDGCVRLTGTLNNWDDIVNAGYMAVDKKRYIGVLNDIKLDGFVELKIRIPKAIDNSLDGLKVDCLVIGGGISGTSILRELTRYNISTLLVEKESDLAMQASGRNDGEVHPGVDLNEGSKKQYYVVRSNPEFGNVCKELDVDFIRRGQYACFEKPIGPILKLFAKFRSMHNCPTTVANKKEIEEKEKYFDKKVKCAVSNPQSGVVSPYELTIAFAENAVSNGAKVSLDTAVLSIEVKDDKIVSVKTNRGTIYPKVVINAAGCFSDKIADMANDRFFTIHPRSGTDFIFDNKTSNQINHISSIVGAKRIKRNTQKVAESLRLLITIY